METIILNNGLKCPSLGIGTFTLAPEEAEQSVTEALKMGYSLVDTANAYVNERACGRAIKNSGLERENIFVSTKLWPSEYGEGLTSKAIDKMLERLGTDYIDLLLLHQQFGDYIGAYKDMERAVKDGRVKSIGLSNFESHRLEEVLEVATIPPSVLQVECHPYYQQNDLKKRIEKYGTVIEAWYPIGHGDKGLINEPLFTKLGQKYGKTNVQIILRWHIQEGTIVFPRSTNPVHIKENFEIFDFELTEDEMNEIRKLDSGKRFFMMTLEEQEKNLSVWTPQD